MSNRIRIIFTSDVHGKTMPYSYANGDSLECGFAKLETLIGSLRDEDTVLVDNGDTLTGSPLQSYHFSKRMNEPSPVSRAMKLMKYDFINVGNHDFDYGVDVLKRHVDYTGARCINLNLGFDYAVKEVANKRIALFGVTTHFTPKWESPEKVAGAVFPDGFTLVKDTVRLIKEKENPDFIVCAYHGGLEKIPELNTVNPPRKDEEDYEDSGVGAGFKTVDSFEKEGSENQGYKMLSEIEGIDAILMGHQHTLSEGVFNGVAYAQPGVDGSWVSVIDIDTDSREKSVKNISLSAEKPVASKLIMDEVMEEEKACQDWLDIPIGKSNVDMRVHDEEFDRLRKSQFITFINMVQMERLKGDMSATSLLLGSTGLGGTEGEITMRQILSSYYFSNSLVKKKISGKVLREYLEKTLCFWEVNENRIGVSPDYMEPIFQHYNYDLLDGVEYAAEISRPRGSRLVSLTRKGKEIIEDDCFTIVLNNYRASGGGDYDMLSNLETVDEDLTDMVEIIAQYIEKNKEIDFKPIYNISITV